MTHIVKGIICIVSDSTSALFDKTFLLMIYIYIMVVVFPRVYYGITLFTGRSLLLVSPIVIFLSS